MLYKAYRCVVFGLCNVLEKFELVLIYESFHKICTFHLQLKNLKMCLLILSLYSCITNKQELSNGTPIIPLGGCLLSAVDELCSNIYLLAPLSKFATPDIWYVWEVLGYNDGGFGDLGEL